jgi:3-hydroxyisobutyrate dehydrogenase
MGRPMARNIARAGIRVRAWNRTREKAEPLAEDGVEVCATAADAVDGASIVLTMLRDGDAVIEAMSGPEGALEAVDQGVVWLQMSTIGLSATERCAEIAERSGLELVDAPVLGTKLPAEKGELLVLASGPDQVRARVQPIFDAVGNRTMWLGQAGRGTRLKLVTNSWLTAVVEGAAEAIALAEGLGLDPNLLLEAVEGGPLDMPYLRLKGRAMIERDFEPSFALELAAKDARLVDEAACATGLELPLLETVRRRLEEAAREHGKKDLAATFLASAPRS